MSQANKELDELKEQADELGIEYSGNIGAETLKKRIEEHLESGQEIETEEPKKTAKEKKDEKIIQQRLEATKLVRVIVIPNDPSKRHLQGDYFSVSNDNFSIKRFVPYNNENGWHIEQAIFNVIKDKKFQSFVTKTVNGQEVKQGVIIPAYNIVKLDDLTERELEELKRSQRARQSVSN